jgi:carbon storage regulator
MKHHIVIEKGKLRSIYNRELEAYYARLNPQRNRASWVEPQNLVLRCLFHVVRWCVSDNSRMAQWTRDWSCQWRINLARSSGPVLGPYTSRLEAISAEVAWLRDNWLLVPKEETMLVLSRKQKEQICIGDDIVLTVVAIKGDVVRIGIEAPQQIPVHRAEIRRKIDSQQQQNTEGDSA